MKTKRDKIHTPSRTKQELVSTRRHSESQAGLKLDALLQQNIRLKKQTQILKSQVALVKKERQYRNIEIVHLQNKIKHLELKLEAKLPQAKVEKRQTRDQFCQAGAVYTTDTLLQMGQSVSKLLTDRLDETISKSKQKIKRLNERLRSFQKAQESRMVSKKQIVQCQTTATKQKNKLRRDRERKEIDKQNEMAGSTAKKEGLTIKSVQSIERQQLAKASPLGQIVNV